ncbi:cytochrome c [Niabella sp.]|uniref:c-type cytochrome n=1 Tax=Niabella sp. TaxID=1962976 RepID=UPI00261F8485|nr:cytochrome c [Niabella sp.]
MKKKNLFSTGILLAFIALVAVNCGGDKKNSVDTPPPSNDCTTGLTAGVNFTAVKSVLAANCVRCHGGSSPQSGINFADNCTIVSKAARIKARAVDLGDMPQGGPSLSQGDKDKITAWVNAGGKYNN